MVKLHHESVCLYFSGFLTLIDKYIVNAAEMLSVGSGESVPFICWLGGRDYEPGPIYSNQKDVQAVTQLISRGQLPLGVGHHLDVTMLKGGRLSAKTWLMYWYSNETQMFFSF